MPPVSHDPAFVAEALCILREHLALTRAEMAARAGISDAALATLEAGTGPVDGAALARLAERLGVAPEAFHKPDDAALAALQTELEADMRRAVLVDLRPMETPMQVAAFVAPGFHALRRHLNGVGGDHAVAAQELADGLETLNLLWEELSEGERARHTTDLSWQAARLKAAGLTCRGGHHRQRARLEPDMVASVGVVVISAAPPETLAAGHGLLVRLEEGWENLEADRERLRALLDAS